MEGGHSSHSAFGKSGGLLGPICSHVVTLSPRLQGQELPRGTPSHGDGRSTRGQAHLWKHISSFSVISANISLAKASHVAEPKVKGREVDGS